MSHYWLSLKLKERHALNIVALFSLANNKYLTPHRGVCYDGVMKNEQQLLNNIIGQLRGVSRMIAEERDCESVIIQLKAVKSSINTLMNRHLQQSALFCLNKGSSMKPQDKKQIEKILKDLIVNNS